MRLGRLFRGLFTTPGGLVLAAGTVGLLVGIEYWMSCGTTRRARSAIKLRPPRETADSPQKARDRTDYFKIRQTRSELGYVYWVLQGFGKHQCFVLFDTWQEAMDDACRRLTEATTEEPALVCAAY